ncbi:hypothetical protein PN613_07010 [Parabacteroides distasonis]|uniref:hypothetical protein n=1 Tax=Parabacteroides distasonis TaxID=823 RepID=UPI0018997D2D|nr:hypothetical protein [Parabacteroides distasonis]MDB8996089.1 hypothetical protein [Parabacteroides distasonis]MDB9070993.1 hypothetical protein [Parabacteroides distasonis]
MAKQILIGIEEQNLNEVAHYLMIYFPYNEEMCSYTDTWMDELYENEYPLVSKGIWSGIINLKTHKLLNWKPEYGSLYLQAKVCDSGTYFLLDKDKKTVCKIADYVPNGLIPEVDDCGDYIRLRINEDGTIENWFEEPDFSYFMEDSEVIEKIDTIVEEEPILDTKVEFTYSQLMAKLFRLPKFIQMEIGKALIANASEEFEKEE